MIAEESGVSLSTVSDLMLRSSTTGKTAAAIAQAFNRLQLRTAPDSPASTRVKTIAKREGWEPALAWDEETIDDPDAEPSRAPKLSTAEWYSELASDGYTDDEIASELNILPSSLRRTLERAS